MSEWFAGTTIGSSFDGVLMVNDPPEETPLRIVLSAGGKAIPCQLDGVDFTKIEGVIGKRALVIGRAHYDGTCGLPVLFEITRAQDVQILEEGADFTKWRGAFEPFEIDDDWFD